MHKIIPPAPELDLINHPPSFWNFCALKFKSQVSLPNIDKEQGIFERFNFLIWRLFISICDI